MQENKNSRRNVKVFDSSNNIAGIPKVVLFFSASIPLMLIMQGMIIIGGTILVTNIIVLLKVYKNDERALSVIFYAIRTRQTYWQAGFKRRKELIIVDNKNY